jgi:adenylate cyclase
VHHIFETKAAHKLFGITDSYTYYIYWTPDYYWILFILLVTIIWTHGTIGIRYYIKQKRWYPKWRTWLSGVAVALPITAIWGVITAIREVDRLALDPAWVVALNAASNPRGVDLYQWGESWGWLFSGLYLLFVLLFFLTRKIVLTFRKQRSSVLIKYLEGTSISVPKGTTLLEASLQAKIPHANVCGGRGRCSTCRVQIIEGLEHLPPPAQEEIDLLSKVKSSGAVRLACRTKPVETCTIYPLLLPNVTLRETLWKRNPSTGTDRNVAILFTDLRGFTAMAEDKLPYDVVFVLNQYFQFMGHAVETHHGRIDKFIGDAIMAVFGIDRDPKQACLDALAAARSMRFQLDRLNAQLKSELTEPLKMGFGIHCGHVIIGEMGYKDSNNLVAIGDATNTASRMESLTKEYQCELIVSSDVVNWAGLDFRKYATYEVELRGRQKPIQIYCIKEVKEMDI